MTELHEALSRLLDGELPSDEARALRDRRVLAAAKPLEHRPWLAVAGWAAAAAAVVVALWPDPRPELILAAGRQWVDGEALLRAGDQVIAIDGAALVTVEPRAPVARGPPARSTAPRPSPPA